jgi:arylsulfatase A-like enzyme
MFAIRAGATYIALAEERVTLAEALAAAGYTTAAFTGGITLDAAIGFDQGFATYTSSMYKLDDSNVGEMLAWIDAQQDAPFFLFWHTFEVHAPYLNADFLPDDRPELRRAYRNLAARVAGDGSFSRHGWANIRLKRLLEYRGAFDASTVEALYAGGIRSADAWVGRLIAFLRERGLYDDALIVLTSDHGEEFADHEPSYFYDRHGHSLYEEMIRIPLIVKLAGRRHAGSRIEAVTRSVDVMPTILEVVGLRPTPDEMQGESLVPLWEGRESQPRTAFSEAGALPDEIKSVRTRRFKYTVEVASEQVEKHGRGFLPETPKRRVLFDLEADPEERRDLLSDEPDPELAEAAAELDRHLRTFLPAVAPEVEEVELDADMVRKLEALGYGK